MGVSGLPAPSEDQHHDLGKQNEKTKNTSRDSRLIKQAAELRPSPHDLYASIFQDPQVNSLPFALVSLLTPSSVPCPAPLPVHILFHFLFLAFFCAHCDPCSPPLLSSALSSSSGASYIFFLIPFSGVFHKVYL